MRPINNHQQLFAVLFYTALGAILLAGATAPTAAEPPSATLAKPKLECGELPNVEGLAVSPDGRLLTTTSRTGTSIGWGQGAVVVCEAATGRVQRRLKVPIKDIRHVGILAFHPRGRLLAAGLEDGSVAVWDVTTGELADRFQAHNLLPLPPEIKREEPIAGLGYSADGGRLMTASMPDRIKLWNVEGPRALARNFVGATREAGIGRAALSRDGRRVAAVLPDDSIQVWDVPSGKSLYVLTDHRRPGQKDDHIVDLAFSPDGALLAAAGNRVRDPNVIRLWDVATGRSIAVLPAQRGGIYAVAFSPDGRSLAAAGSTDDDLSKPVGEVIVWDVKSHRERGRFRAHRGEAKAVAFLPDGQTLATVGIDDYSKEDGADYGSVRLWDLRAIQAGK